MRCVKGVMCTLCKFINSLTPRLNLSTVCCTAHHPCGSKLISKAHKEPSILHCLYVPQRTRPSLKHLTPASIYWYHFVQSPRSSCLTLLNANNSTYSNVPLLLLLVLINSHANYSPVSFTVPVHSKAFVKLLSNHAWLETS